MANHGFLSTKKFMNQEQLCKDIEKIRQTRFKGKLEIRTDVCDLKTEGKIRYWWLFLPDEKNPFDDTCGFSVWMTSKRKLEFRHPRGDWMFWAQCVVQHDLGVKYKGTISDEGVDGTWKPNKEKWTTYRAWVAKKFERVPKFLVRGRLIKWEMEQVPKPLKGL